MKKVSNELYCRKCGHDFWTEHSEGECPECGSNDVYNSRFLICDCGETIYLNGMTNECLECGRLYNKFGQELAPVEEWEEEDRYDCF